MRAMAEMVALQVELLWSLEAAEAQVVDQFTRFMVEHCQIAGI